MESVMQKSDQHLSWWSASPQCDATSSWKGFRPLLRNVPLLRSPHKELHARHKSVRFSVLSKNENELAMLKVHYDKMLTAWREYVTHFQPCTMPPVVILDNVNHF